MGFTSRLAGLNGLSMRVFLREMRILPHDLDKSRRDAIDAVATLGNVDPEALARFTPFPWGDSKLVTIGAEALHSSSVRRTYFCICPHCIRDDLSDYQGPMSARPWLRLDWIVTHYRSCDRHNVILVPKTPIRRRYEPFDFTEWINRTVVELDDLSASTIAAPPSPFQKWLTSRLEGKLDPDCWLDDMQLYAAVDLCETLGLSALHAPKVLVTSLTDSDRAAAADEGFRIASQGGDEIERLLMRLADAQSTTRGFWGLRDTFGHAYGLLETTKTNPAYAKPRTIFRRVAVARVPIEAGTDVLGEILEKQVVHTIRSASNTSGAHSLTIRRLFERKRLRDEETLQLMDHRVTISSDEVDELLTSLKTALTTTQVRKATGIPRNHLFYMIKAGYLTTVTGSNEKAYAKHRFTQAAVDESLERLFSGVVSVAKPTGRQMSILRARQASVSGLNEIIDFLFSGRIWKGLLSGRREYGALLVDADEIIAAIREGRSKSGFTKAETAKFIVGMGRDSVGKFVAAGHLELVEEFSPEARRNIQVVSRQSAQAFLRNYVSLGELSQNAGLHHKQIRSALRRANIEASFDPEAFRGFFYVRAAVKGALQSVPDLWSSGVKRKA
ncbi:MULTISPECIES: TniQ family protein [unclassified Bradyrhizobium]|uniref:TniQ family protein n=1 Tax=unclassified Bradyrhizobium TaxID=2631580 RepID=UPI0028E963EE|nr:MULTISPECIES: TniQ family protein [unclassified Bradyrhizobium]